MAVDIEKMNAQIRAAMAERWAQEEIIIRPSGDGFQVLVKIGHRTRAWGVGIHKDPVEAMALALDNWDANRAPKEPEPPTTPERAAPLAQDPAAAPVRVRVRKRPA